MMILLAVLFGGVAISGGVYYAVFRAMPWQLHDSDISFNQEYEYHSNSTYSDQKATHDLTFNSFLELYQINPDKWEFYMNDPQYYGHNTNSFRLFYNTEQDNVQVIFSKSDFVKFRKWLHKNIHEEMNHKNHTDNSSKNKKSAAACQFLLEDVQKDIDKMREDAQKQIDEARELTNSVAIRYLEDRIELVPITQAEPSQVKGIYIDEHGRQWSMGDGGKAAYEFMD